MLGNTEPRADLSPAASTRYDTGTQSAATQSLHQSASGAQGFGAHLTKPSSGLRRRMTLIWCRTTHVMATPNGPSSAAPSAAYRLRVQPAKTQ